MNIRSIGIIGGTNGIGKAFAEYLEASAENSLYSVYVSGRQTETTNQWIVENCDLVIFSVPIQATIRVIEEMLPFSQKDQIWADFTSIKLGVVEVMKKSEAHVVGLHPLFGPMRDIGGHKVFYCPERIGPSELRAVFEVFEKFTMIEKSATEHDQLMGVIQNVSHMSDLVMGATLRSLGVDMKEVQEFASASYKLKLEVMGRMFFQSPELYAGIATENRYGADFVQQFCKDSERINQMIQSENSEALVREFQGISDYLGADFCKRSFDRSQRFMKSYRVKSPDVSSRSVAEFGVFGEPFSHTDEVSYRFGRTDFSGVRYFSSISDLVEAVDRGEVEEGIVPVENSVYGTVVETLDSLFAANQVYVQGMVEQDISQNLLGIPGTKLSDIKKIYSHPQALGQSKNWIVLNLEAPDRVPKNSTAHAAKYIAEQNNYSEVCIGSKGLSEAYGLSVLAPDIQAAENRTKFLQVSGRAGQDGEQGVSFVIWFSDDHTGALVELLQYFQQNDINLSRLDSRRLQKEKIGRYAFFFDAEISAVNFLAKRSEIEALVAGLKFLGSW